MAGSGTQEPEGWTIKPCDGCGNSRLTVSMREILLRSRKLPMQDMPVAKGAQCMEVLICSCGGSIVALRAIQAPGTGCDVESKKSLLTRDLSQDLAETSVSTKTGTLILLCVVAAFALLMLWKFLTGD